MLKRQYVIPPERHVSLLGETRGAGRKFSLAMDDIYDLERQMSQAFPCSLVWFYSTEGVANLIIQQGIWAEMHKDLGYGIILKKASPSQFCYNYRGWRAQAARLLFADWETALQQSRFSVAFALLVKTELLKDVPNSPTRDCFLDLPAMQALGASQNDGDWFLSVSSWAKHGTPFSYAKAFWLGTYEESDADAETAAKLRKIVDEGMQQERIGNWRQAISFYERVLQVDPRSTLARNCYAFINMNHMKRYDLAEQHFSQVARLEPLSARAHVNYGALLANQLDRPEQAETEFKEAIRAEPNSAIAHSSYGLLLTTKLPRYQMAEKHFLLALQCDNSNATYHNNYAFLLHRHLHRYDGAQKLYKLALERDPHYTFAHANYGALLMDLGQWEAAQTHFLKALHDDPGFSIAHYSYAVLLETYLKRPQQAEKHYAEAIRADPQFADAHYAYGSLLASKGGRVDKAERHLMEATRWNPSDTKAREKLRHLRVSKNKGENGQEGVGRVRLDHRGYPSSSSSFSFSPFSSSSPSLSSSSSHPSPLIPSTSPSSAFFLSFPPSNTGVRVSAYDRAGGEGRVTPMTRQPRPSPHPIRFDSFSGPYRCCAEGEGGLRVGPSPHPIRTVSINRPTDSLSPVFSSSSHSSSSSPLPICESMNVPPVCVQTEEGCVGGVREGGGVGRALCPSSSSSPLFSPLDPSFPSPPLPSFSYFSSSPISSSSLPSLRLPPLPPLTPETHVQDTVEPECWEAQVISLWEVPLLAVPPSSPRSASPAPPSYLHYSSPMVGEAGIRGALGVPETSPRDILEKCKRNADKKIARRLREREGLRRGL
uniref:Uncharacterized protein n=1 Tax=Chromera velia CCMP2878 TaxID=1169474 RepID=A0A0G4HFZ3_9ALVE|eukprot:Cvel_6658.t1-p1 / transcript=Cvel_6658.t1 / gene=Cvel_6658 / organism=Chromera_velia_CCMP2878 / gene_product=Transmembrane and TPR repeat-containing protein, putative / transcript_product=Transmembrane and TPR repeat-containing protein, putative / location=Cvel_scaffold330:92384-98090(+) / protein_length=823 / sequence_SO=supercontig / SO=protein_coding / is_pseudo=false